MKVDSLRKRVDKFLEVRKKTKKSLLLVQNYKRVDMDQKLFKINDLGIDVEKNNRKDEIEDVRVSNEYSKSPNIFPLNPLRGNKVKEITGCFYNMLPSYFLGNP